jgi:hypothetical protein
LQLKLRRQAGTSLAPADSVRQGGALGYDMIIATDGYPANSPI